MLNESFAKADSGKIRETVNFIVRNDPLGVNGSVN